MVREGKELGKRPSGGRARMEAEDRMGGGAWQDREAGGDPERRGGPWAL